MAELPKYTETRRPASFDGAFVAPAVERAWRQARGEPDDETAPTVR